MILGASEHRGVVSSKGLPIPGATVKATLGEELVTAYTDEQGAYTLSNLKEGNWRMEVEMFGFEGKSRIVGVPSAEPATWELEVAQPRLETVPADNRAESEGQGRLAVNRMTEAEILARLEGAEFGGAAAIESLQQDASESYLVSGSVSSGLQLNQQIGAMFGRGMRPDGGFEDGAPAGTPSIFGGAQETQAAVEPGGPGGMRGAGEPGGGSGGPGGMGGRFAGRLGGGPGAGGRPRPESREGDASGRERERPEWMMRRGVAAFGNRRSGGRPVIRGRVFFSFNDSSLDARPYSISGQQIAKPQYSKYRFGGGAGGQLRIPKLLESPGTFFFVNYSGTRSSNPFDRISTVPTEAERAGDFSMSGARRPTTIFDPAAGQPFPGNIIPAARISPAAAGLMEFIPVANLSGEGVQNYQYVTSVPRDTDNFGLRVNHGLTDRDRFAGSLQLQRRHSEAAQLYGFHDDSDGGGLSASISWTRNLTPNLINALTGKYSYNRTETLPYFAFGPDVAGELGIEGTAPGDLNNGPPDLTFTNFGSLTSASPLLRRDQAASLAEGITWVRGNHTVKAGFEYRRNQVNTITEANGRGVYSFSGLVTSGFDGGGNPAPATGFDMADFVLGFPQSSSIRWGNPDVYFRGSNYSAYAGDDWRVSGRLTINFGLRYEFSEPLYEKYGRVANLSIAPGFAGVAVVTPEIPSPYSGAYPKALVDADGDNFSPRIGVAWRPWAKRGTLIRSGYGIYYNGSIYNSIAGRLGQQPPFANTNTFSTSVNHPLTITEGLLGSPGASITNTFGVARDYMAGYAQTWNLKVQQNLPAALVLELGYLGTKGTRLDVQRLPNQAPPGSPADSEDRRPIPYAVGFIWDSSDGNSIYHAGQVRLLRRFRRGLAFQSLYTWGKSIDNVSSYGGGQATVAQDPVDLTAERGLSSFDVRHSFELSFLLASPVGDGPSTIVMDGMAEKLLKDWNLTGGITANSGNPLTATVLGNRSDAGGTGVVGSSRASATGLPVNRGAGFFNPLAFTTPEPGNYGNAGRNTIPGASLFVMNLSLGRSFSVGERRRLEFRVSANNLLNNVSYTRFGTTVNANNYGLATGAAAMRTITGQVSLRF